MISKQPSASGATVARVAAVLAGGAGARFGGGKPAALLAGKPLVSYPVAAARAAGLEPWIVAKPNTELPNLDARVILEPPAPEHPLCGIVAALEAAGEPIVVIACDMPFASPRLIAHLAAAGDPLVVPAPDGGPEPLLARYDSALLDGLRSGLESHLPVRRVVEELGPRLIDTAELLQIGDPDLMFRNVNDAADLARAETILGG